MLKALLDELLETCDNLQCDAGKIGIDRCWQCNGSGKQLSAAGREFMTFLHDYCNVAQEDHSHYIS